MFLRSNTKTQETSLKPVPLPKTTVKHRTKTEKPVLDRSSSYLLNKSAEKTVIEVEEEQVNVAKMADNAAHVAMYINGPAKHVSPYNGAYHERLETFLDKVKEVTELIAPPDETEAELNSRRAKITRFRLGDRALGYVASLGVEVKNNFTTLKAALEERFGPVYTAGDYNNMLVNLKQARRPVREVVSEVEDLTNKSMEKAFAGLVLTDANKQAVLEEQYKQGLIRALDPELRVVLVQDDPQTWRQTKESAFKAERVLVASNELHGRRPRLHMMDGAGGLPHDDQASRLERKLDDFGRRMDSLYEQVRDVRKGQESMRNEHHRELNDLRRNFTRENSRNVGNPTGRNGTNFDRRYGGYQNNPERNNQPRGDPWHQRNYRSLDQAARWNNNPSANRQQGNYNAYPNPNNYNNYGNWGNSNYQEENETMVRNNRGQTNTSGFPNPNQNTNVGNFNGPSARNQTEAARAKQ